MDLTERLLAAAIENWPLVAAIAVSGYWIFPKMLRITLLNGGGDIIRGIVKSENSLQKDELTREMSQRFTQHEDEESRWRAEIVSLMASSNKINRRKTK